MKWPIWYLPNSPTSLSTWSKSFSESASSSWFFSPILCFSFSFLSPIAFTNPLYAHQTFESKWKLNRFLSTDPTSNRTEYGVSNFNGEWIICTACCSLYFKRLKIRYIRFFYLYDVHSHSQFHLCKLTFSSKKSTHFVFEANFCCWCSSYRVPVIKWKLWLRQRKCNCLKNPLDFMLMNTTIHIYVNALCFYCTMYIDLNRRLANALINCIFFNWFLVPALFFIYLFACYFIYFTIWLWYSIKDHSTSGSLSMRTVWWHSQWQERAYFDFMPIQCKKRLCRFQSNYRQRSFHDTFSNIHEHEPSSFATLCRQTNNQTQFVY